MPHAGYTDSVMNDGPRFHLDISNKELPEPVTQAIEVTLSIPTLLFQYMSIHSSILMHAFIHSFIHPFIHTFISYIQALHMQLLHHNASRHVTKR